MARFTDDDGTSPIVGVLVFGVVAISGLPLLFGSDAGVLERLGGVAMILCGGWGAALCAILTVRLWREP